MFFVLQLESNFVVNFTFIDDTQIFYLMEQHLLLWKSRLTTDGRNIVLEGL